MSAPAIDPPLGTSMLRVLVRPDRALPELTTASARLGAAAVALCGLLWTVLLLLLFFDHRAPSVTLVPIPRDLYYMVQGLLTTPILTALWWILCEVAHRLCKALGGQGERSAVAATLGFAYALPLTAHVLAETVAFFGFGFAALASVARLSLPIAALWTWALASLALRAAHRVSWPRAIGSALAGLVVQALLGGIVLR